MVAGQRRQMLKRVNVLIKDIDRHGNEGIGKPEPLKHSLAGYWSRRINDEHRLVYTIKNGQIYIISYRHHYGNP